MLIFLFIKRTLFYKSSFKSLRIKNVYILLENKKLRMEKLICTCRNEESKLRWLGHVNRMGEERITETNDEVNGGG